MKKTIFMICTLLQGSVFGQLDSLFSRSAAYGHFNGVVSVYDNGNPYFQGVHGLANEQSAIDSSTAFDIGSVTKQFTAACMLLLVKEGKVRLDDHINLYLGPYANDLWEKVTIHQLLTHTSGIPSLFQTEQGLPLVFPSIEPVTRSQLVGYFSKGKLLFSPGKKFSYSNSGYILLALIIEQQSGMAFGDFLQSRIFEPYQMMDAHYGMTADDALPYYGYRPDLTRSAPIYHPSWFIGAGGVYASADDLNKWIAVLTSGNFLDKEYQDLLWARHTRQFGYDYGYGWQIGADGWVFHDGANAGYCSWLGFNRQTGSIIIILTNRGFEDISQYGHASEKMKEWVALIKKDLKGLDYDIPPLYSPNDFHVGKFNFEGKTLNVRRKDTIAMISMEEGFPTRLVPSTPLVGETSEEMDLKAIALALEKGKYWSLARYCDGEMKFVTYSGLFAIGFKMIKKKVGGFKEIIPYFVADDYGLLRMKGNQRDLDLIVYFDEEHKISGVFENGFHSSEAARQIIAYPIDNNVLWVDGFPYGEASAILEVSEEAHFTQSGRSISGRRLN